MEQDGIDHRDSLPVKSLVVVFSFHHNNTEKIAKTIAKILDAQVKTPQEIRPEELKEYDLVGFGSGIYSAKHHESLLDLADQLPHVMGKKAFIFSTYGAPAFFADRDFIENNHWQLREKLQGRGYIVTGEFGCAGWNTNSFLKFFGGLNKGRPNDEDIRNAEAFAENIKQLTSREKMAIQREIS